MRFITCVLVLANFVPLNAAEPKALPLPKAKKPITIDGILDEDIWKETPLIEADWIWGKIGEKSKEPRMKAWYTWDEDYLYLAYETFDKNLIALGTGEKKGPKNNLTEIASIHRENEKVDVVEFFLSFGDSGIFWEVHHNALNHFNDILITVVEPTRPVSKSMLFFDGIRFGTREVIEDDPDVKVTRKMAVKLKAGSTVNQSGDKDTGYIGEIRLPWLGLGAPRERMTTKVIEETPGKKKSFRGPWKMHGQEMMILGVVQDGDTKEHYFHSSPTKPGGWFHKGTEHWPRYLLTEKN